MNSNESSKSRLKHSLLSRRCLDRKNMIELSHDISPLNRVREYNILLYCRPVFTKVYLTAKELDSTQQMLVESTLQSFS